MSLETTTNPEMRAQGWVLCSEAAREIGKAVQTIYRWIDADKVEGMDDGYRRYVKWNSMMEHLGPRFARAKGLKKLKEKQQ